MRRSKSISYLSLKFECNVLRADVKETRYALRKLQNGFCRKKCCNINRKCNSIYSHFAMLMHHREFSTTHQFLDNIIASSCMNSDHDRNSNKMSESGGESSHNNDNCIVDKNCLSPSSKSETSLLEGRSVRSVGQTSRKPKRVFIRRNSEHTAVDNDKASTSMPEMSDEKEKLESAKLINIYDTAKSSVNHLLGDSEDDLTHLISVQDNWRQTVYNKREGTPMFKEARIDSVDRTTVVDKRSHSSFCPRERRVGRTNRRENRSSAWEHHDKINEQHRNNTYNNDKRAREFESSYRSKNRNNMRESRSANTFRDKTRNRRESSRLRTTFANVENNTNNIFLTACKRLPSPPKLPYIINEKYKDKSENEQNEIAASIIQSYFITLRRITTLFRHNVLGMAAVICGRAYLIDLVETILKSNVTSSRSVDPSLDKSSQLHSCHIKEECNIVKHVEQQQQQKKQQEDQKETNCNINSNNNNYKRNSNNDTNFNDTSEKNNKDNESNTIMDCSTATETSSQLKLKWTVKLAEEIIWTFAVLDGRINYLHIAEEAGAYLLSEYEKQQKSLEQLTTEKKLKIEHYVQSFASETRKEQSQHINEDRIMQQNTFRSSTQINKDDQKKHLLQLSTRLRRNTQLSNMVLKILLAWGQSTGDINKILIPYQQRRRNISEGMEFTEFSPMLESESWEWEAKNEICKNLCMEDMERHKSHVAKEGLTDTMHKSLLNAHRKSERERAQMSFGIQVKFPVNLERYLTEILVPAVMKDLNEMCELFADDECELDSKVLESCDLTDNLLTFREKYSNAFLSSIEVEAFSSAIQICSKLLLHKLFYVEYDDEKRCTRYLRIRPPHWAHKLRTNTNMMPQQEERNKIIYKERSATNQLKGSESYATHMACNLACERNVPVEEESRLLTKQKYKEEQMYKEECCCTSSSSFSSSSSALKDNLVVDNSNNSRTIDNNTTYDNINNNELKKTCNQDESEQTDKTDGAAVMSGRIKPIRLKSFVLALRKFTRSVFALKESSAWTLDAPISKSNEEMSNQHSTNDKKTNNDFNDNTNSNNGNNNNVGKNYQAEYSDYHYEANKFAVNNSELPKMKFGKITFNFDSIYPIILFLINKSSFEILLDSSNDQESELICVMCDKEQRMREEEIANHVNLERELVYNYVILMKIILSWLPVARTFQIANISTIFSKLVTEVNSHVATKHDDSLSNPLRWSSTESWWNDTDNSEMCIKENSNNKTKSTNDILVNIDREYLTRLQRRVLSEIRYYYFDFNENGESFKSQDSKVDNNNNNYYCYNKQKCKQTEKIHTSVEKQQSCLLSCHKLQHPKLKNEEESLLFTAEAINHVNNVNYVCEAIMSKSVENISLNLREVFIKICNHADASFDCFSPSDSAALCSSLLKIFQAITGKARLSDLSMLSKLIEDNDSTKSRNDSNNDIVAYCRAKESSNEMLKLLKLANNIINKILQSWVSLQIARVRFTYWRVYECPYIRVLHPFITKFKEIYKDQITSSLDTVNLKEMPTEIDNFRESKQNVNFGNSSSSNGVSKHNHLTQPCCNEKQYNAAIVEIANVHKGGKGSVDRENDATKLNCNDNSHCKNINEFSLEHQELQPESSITLTEEVATAAAKATSIDNNTGRAMEAAHVTSDLFNQDTKLQESLSLTSTWDTDLRRWELNKNNFLVCIIPWYYYAPWGVHRFITTATYTPMEVLTQCKASTILSTQPLSVGQREHLIFFVQSTSLFETLEARQIYDLLNSYFPVAYKEDVQHFFKSNCVILLAREKVKKYTENNLINLIHVLELSCMYSVLYLVHSNDNICIAHQNNVHECKFKVENNDTCGGNCTASNAKILAYQELSSAFSTPEQLIEEIIRLSKVEFNLSQDVHLYTMPSFYHLKRWYMDTFSTFQSLSLLAHYLSVCTYPTPTLELRVFVLSVAVKISNEFITLVSRTRIKRKSLFTNYLRTIILPFYLLLSVYIAEEQQANVNNSYNGNSGYFMCQVKILDVLRKIHSCFEKMLLQINVNNSILQESVMNSGNTNGKVSDHNQTTRITNGVNSNNNFKSINYYDNDDNNKNDNNNNININEYCFDNKKRNANSANERDEECNDSCLQQTSKTQTRESNFSSRECKLDDTNVTLKEHFISCSDTEVDSTHKNSRLKRINESCVSNNMGKINSSDAVELTFRSCAILSKCLCVKLPSSCLSLIEIWTSTTLGNSSPLHLTHLLSVFTECTFFNQNKFIDEHAQIKSESTSLEPCNAHNCLMSRSTEPHSAIDVWDNVVYPYIVTTYNLFRGKGTLAWTLLPYILANLGKSQHICQQSKQYAEMVLFALDSLREDDFMTIESVLWVVKQIYCIDWTLLTSLPAEYASYLEVNEKPECTQKSKTNRNNDNNNDNINNDNSSGNTTCKERSEYAVNNAYKEPLSAIMCCTREQVRSIQSKVYRVIYNNFAYFLKIKFDSLQPMLEILTLLCKAETNAIRFVTHHNISSKRVNVCEENNMENKNIDDENSVFDSGKIMKKSIHKELSIQLRDRNLLEDCVSYLTLNMEHLEMAYWKSSDKTGRFKIIQPQILCHLMSALNELPVIESSLAGNDNENDSNNNTSVNHKHRNYRANDKYNELHLNRRYLENRSHAKEHEQEHKKTNEATLEAVLAKLMQKRNVKVKAEVLKFIIPLIDISSLVMCKHFSTFSHYLFPFIQLISKLCPNLLSEFLTVALGVKYVGTQCNMPAKEAEETEHEKMTNNTFDKNNHKLLPFHLSQRFSPVTITDKEESHIGERKSTQERSIRENRWIEQRRNLLKKVEINKNVLLSGADDINKLIRAIIYIADYVTPPSAFEEKEKKLNKFVTSRTSHLANHSVSDSVYNVSVNYADRLNNEGSEFYDENVENNTDDEDEYKECEQMSKRTSRHRKIDSIYGNIDSTAEKSNKYECLNYNKLSMSKREEQQTTLQMNTRSNHIYVNEVDNTSHVRDNSLTLFNHNESHKDKDTRESLLKAITTLMELIEKRMYNLSFGAFANVDLNLITQALKVIEVKRLNPNFMNWFTIELTMYIANLCQLQYANYSSHLQALMFECNSNSNRNNNMYDNNYNNIIIYNNNHYNNVNIIPAEIEHAKEANNVKINIITEYGGNKNDQRKSGNYLIAGDKQQQQQQQHDLFFQHISSNSSFARKNFFSFSVPHWWNYVFYSYNCYNHPIYLPIYKTASCDNDAQKSSVHHKKFVNLEKFKDCVNTWYVYSSIPSLLLYERESEKVQWSSTVANREGNANEESCLTHFSPHCIAIHEQETHVEQPKTCKSNQRELHKLSLERQETTEKSSESPLKSKDTVTDKYKELSQYFNKLPREMRNVKLSVWLSILEYHNKFNVRILRERNDRFDSRCHSSQGKTSLTNKICEISLNKRTSESATQQSIAKEAVNDNVDLEHLFDMNDEAKIAEALKKNSIHQSNSNRNTEFVNISELLALFTSTRLRSFYIFTTLSTAQIQHIRHMLGPLQFLHLACEIVDTYVNNTSAEQRCVIKLSYRAHSKIWRAALRYGSDVKLHTQLATSTSREQSWMLQEPHEWKYPWLLPSSSSTNTTITSKTTSVLGDEFIYSWMKLAWETLSLLATSPKTFMSVLTEQALINQRQSKESSTERKWEEYMSQSEVELEYEEEEEEKYEKEIKANTKSANVNSTEKFDLLELRNSGSKIEHNKPLNDLSSLIADNAKSTSEQNNNNNNNNSNKEMTFDKFNDTSSPSSSLSREALYSSLDSIREKLNGYNGETVNVTIDLKIIVKLLSLVECSQLALRERQISCALESWMNCDDDNTTSLNAEPVELKTRNKIQCDNYTKSALFLPLLECGKMKGAPVDIIKEITQNLIKCTEERAAHERTQNNSNVTQVEHWPYNVKVNWQVRNYIAITDYRKECPLLLTKAESYSGKQIELAIVIDNNFKLTSKLSKRVSAFEKSYTRSDDSCYNSNANSEQVEQQKIHYNRMMHEKFAFSATSECRREKLIGEAVNNIIDNYLRREQHELDYLLKQCILKPSLFTCVKDNAEERYIADKAEPELRKLVASLMPTDIVRLLEIITKENNNFIELENTSAGVETTLTTNKLLSKEYTSSNEQSVKIEEHAQQQQQQQQQQQEQQQEQHELLTQTAIVESMEHSLLTVKRKRLSPLLKLQLITFFDAFVDLLNIAKPSEIISIVSIALLLYEHEINKENRNAMSEYCRFHHYDNSTNIIRNSNVNQKVTDCVVENTPESLSMQLNENVSNAKVNDVANSKEAGTITRSLLQSLRYLLSSVPLIIANDVERFRTKELAYLLILLHQPHVASKMFITERAKTSVSLINRLENLARVSESLTDSNVLFNDSLISTQVIRAVENYFFCTQSDETLERYLKFEEVVRSALRDKTEGKLWSAIQYNVAEDLLSGKCVSSDTMSELLIFVEVTTNHEFDKQTVTSTRQQQQLSELQQY